MLPEKANSLKDEGGKATSLSLTYSGQGGSKVWWLGCRREKRVANSTAKSKAR